MGVSVFRRVLARLWPQSRPAHFDEYAAGPADLTGRPGAMTNYMVLSDRGNRTGWDVCCPGCGVLVAALDPFEYPVGGIPAPGSGGSLTCHRSIHWSGCCGWYGRLTNGVWQGRR